MFAWHSWYILLLSHIYLMYFHVCVASMEMRWCVRGSSSRVCMFFISRCMIHATIDMILDGWIMMLLLHRERLCYFSWCFSMMHVVDKILHIIWMSHERFICCSYMGRLIMFLVVLLMLVNFLLRSRVDATICWCLWCFGIYVTVDRDCVIIIWGKNMLTLMAWDQGDDDLCVVDGAIFPNFILLFLMHRLVLCWCFLY